MRAEKGRKTEPNDWIWAGGWRRKFLEAVQEWLNEETLGKNSGRHSSQWVFLNADDETIGRVVPQNWKRFAKATKKVC